jgi:GNAT superfamily N-acetyltransferase
MQYVPMQPRHAEQVAEIHIEGQPGTLLTKLGKPFLTTMYREICRSEWGFGMVALEGDKVVGVGVLTTSTRQLFRDLKRRRLVKLLLPIIPRLLTRPRLLLDVYQSWRYPAKMGGAQTVAGAGDEQDKRGQRSSSKDPTLTDAEFLYLGVREAYRGQKIGSGVFDASIGHCRERQIDYLIALVEHSNWESGLSPKLAHHATHDGWWRCIRQMELNGKLMDVIELDLTHEVGG